MNWSKIPSKENGTHDFISSASCSIMISISGFSPASFTNSPFNGDTWRPFYGVRFNVQTRSNWNHLARGELSSLCARFGPKS